MIFVTSNLAFNPKSLQKHCLLYSNNMLIIANTHLNITICTSWTCCSSKIINLVSFDSALLNCVCMHCMHLQRECILQAWKDACIQRNDRNIMDLHKIACRMCMHLSEMFFAWLRIWDKNTDIWQVMRHFIFTIYCFNIKSSVIHRIQIWQTSQPAWV